MPNLLSEPFVSIHRAMAKSLSCDGFMLFKMNAHCIMMIEGHFRFSEVVPTIHRKYYAQELQLLHVRRTYWKITTLEPHF